MDVSLFGGGDRLETVEMMTASFCRFDPVEVALSVTPEEFRTMIALELAAVPPDDLSLVGRDEKTGRIIAAAIVTDATAEPVDSCGPASVKLAPIADIARTYHDRYFATRRIEPGSHAYIFAIGIHPDRVGGGLGWRIAVEAVRRAVLRGYRAAFSMTTNRASARILQRLGFQVVESVRYQDYRYEGRAVFASISDPSIDLWECADLRGLAAVRDLV